MNLNISSVITHDQIIEKIFSELKVANKKKITSLFLASLSSNNLEWRSGLSVYAIMQTFPNHKFMKDDRSIVDQALYDKMSNEDKLFTNRITPCGICSEFEKVEIEYDLIEESFNECGGLLGHQLLDYYYYLSEVNKLDSVIPIKDDYRILLEIIEFLDSTEPNQTTKKDTLNKIKRIKGFNSNSEQAQTLLETLGYCSIIETEKHKGLLNQYTNLAIAPAKTHNSDWRYPVDFWLGKDGINIDAFQFWFCNYPQLKQIWN